MAVVAVLSPARPTGTRVADAVWAAAFAGLVALAGSRSRPGPLLWLGAIAALAAVGGGGAGAVLGVAALAGAIALVALDRRSPTAGGLVAGLGVLALLSGHTFGPTGLPSVVAAVAVAPVLLAAWRSLGPVGRRRTLVAGAAVAAVVLVASAMALVAALRVRSELSDSARQAKDALGLVRDGEVAAAVPELDDATTGFADASGALGGVLALPGRLVPVVGHQVEAVRRVSAAGEELTSAAARAARQADYQSLRSDSGRVDLVQMAAMQQPLDASIDAAHHARQVLDDVRSPWLVAPLAHQLDSLGRQLDDTVPTAELASRALGVAPTLLGGGSPQRYLLQFATPGESRGAGGYVGTYGVLTADGGELHLETTGATEDLNVADGGAPRLYDPPPGWDQLYGEFHVGRFPGNVSADPDWPTDSDVARQLYRQVPEVGAVAGTIYADPTALAALLEAIGPVYVPSLDRELDATTVEDYLLVEQYAAFNSDDDATNLARRQVLGDVVEAVFDALTTRELPELQDLLSILGPAVAGGHLKIDVFDEPGRALVDDVGLSGAWDPTPGADHLSLRSTDLLMNKIGVFLDRTMQVDVALDEAQRQVRSTVTVTLTNRSPASGLPVYVIGNQQGLPMGTNLSEMAVYSPLGLEGATLDGQVVGMSSQDYAGGHVYGFPVEMAPGQTRVLVLHLVGRTAGEGTYRLDLIPQPLAHPDQVTVTVRDGSTATLFDGPLETRQLLTAGG